jgi:superfamily II DNA/RNA helicase
MLVLDEADRILDLGFDRELRAIVQSLPETRQTLLFSATLTKSVRALAQLSLKSPEFVLPLPTTADNPQFDCFAGTVASMMQQQLVLPHA